MLITKKTIATDSAQLASMNSYQRCSLFFIPQTAQFSSGNLDQFCEQLASTGLTGEAIAVDERSTTTEQHFLTGPKFLDLISYMGCSPAVNFEAGEANDSYCYIKVYQKEAAELIYCRTQLKPPSCPRCKTLYPELSSSLSTSDGAHLSCPSCDSQTSAAEINWRKQAGYARLFIEVTDIFPKEAIPQHTLLDNLKNISGVDWKYFYSCR